MENVNEMLAYNRKFVEEKRYEKYITTKYPDKKIAIVTCMDTRLVELLPASLGIGNGDVKMIKNAGGFITDPYDSVMRSILVAVYELGVTHVMIIGHTNCGVLGMDPDEMLGHMRARGISDLTIERVNDYARLDLKQWLTGFTDTEQAVHDTVALVSHHPLLPADVAVTGYVMDIVTGELKAL